MNNNDYTILVLDDDQDIREMAGLFLEKEGYKVLLAANVDEFWDLIESHSVSLVMIDLLMPDVDGISVLKDFRKRFVTPTIMISGRGEHIDKKMGIEAGADDYVTKPFVPQDLLLHIQALLRRAHTYSAFTRGDKLYFDNYVIDPQTYQVSKLCGGDVPLTTSEFFLLNMLVRNHGKAISREQILQELRKNNFDIFDRAVDVQISKIRAKLADDTQNPKYIRTVRNVGYMFCSPVTDTL